MWFRKDNSSEYEKYDLGWLEGMAEHPFPSDVWFDLFEYIYDREREGASREDILYVILLVANIAAELELKKAIYNLQLFKGESKEMIVNELKSYIQPVSATKELKTSDGV